MLQDGYWNIECMVCAIPIISKLNSLNTLSTARHIIKQDNSIFIEQEINYTINYALILIRSTKTGFLISRYSCQLRYILTFIFLFIWLNYPKRLLTFMLFDIMGVFFFNINNLQINYEAPKLSFNIFIHLEIVM